MEKKKTEPVDITTGWEVRFDTNWGGCETYRMDTLKNWAEVEEEGVKYYSGTATYSCDFNMQADALQPGAAAYVMFEDIQEMARVNINGNDCGILWLPPYITNITKWLKPGKNNITVQVVNTWNNRIVGDLSDPGKPQYTRTNIKTSKFRANSPLLKSGLLGKAKIVFTDN